MKEQINELKPCPFCGKKYTNIRHVEHPVLNGSLYYVYCDECGASTVACATVDDAVKCWNRRDDDDDDE